MHHRNRILVTRFLQNVTISGMDKPAAVVVSTHMSLAGRDFRGLLELLNLAISTHTPLAGRNKVMKIIAVMSPNFYSHAPRGAQHGAADFKVNGNQFLLTRPSRGATISILAATPEKLISTHTPLAGRDSPLSASCRRKIHTRPSRGATATGASWKFPSS